MTARSLGPYAARVAGWGAVVVTTVLAAHGVPARIVCGVTMTAAGLALQFTGDRRSVRTSTVAISVATVCGLVATLAGPSGVGEIPAYVAASRIAFPIDKGFGRVFVVADTLAVSAVVGYVSQSLVGALAGLGIPLLAQRAVERRALISARDEARALLLEVQAGREAETQAAALRERGRIARDLHDVLAHSLAGLSVHLQAARALAARDHAGQALTDQLDKAAGLARDGLVEARSVVGTLHEPAAPGLAELPGLIDRHPAAVELRVDGEPVPVSAEVGHALYRAVQEALTNAARYAPGAEITVELAYRPGAVSVRILDSGAAPGRAPAAGHGGGLGLAGMAERLTGVGGRASAGPVEGGGWRVDVCAPAAVGTAGSPS